MACRGGVGWAKTLGGKLRPCLTDGGWLIQEMARYGVKTKAGKVIWIAADAVESRDGALFFIQNEGGKPEIVAGFPLANVDHFGRPEAFVSGDGTGA